MWDALKEARNHGFQHAPGGSNTPGSIVAYCLGITDVEPIHAGLSETNFLYRPALPSWYIDLSDDGQIFQDQHQNRGQNQEFSDSVSEQL